MLTSPTTPILRFGVLGSRGLQLQSALSIGSPTITSLAQRQITAASSNRHMCTKSQTTAAPRNARSLQCQPIIIRRYASATATAAAYAESGRPLDWNTFFTLRKTRRRFQLACSITTMFTGAALAGATLATIDIEFLGKLPIDPFLALGLMTMGCAALGWLAGPSLGSIIFYTIKRGVKGPMAVKEAEFFARIKKNRVDPSVSSVGNPVPDYYGEKISSVAGYRQWLKDQRAFNKKRTSFV